jgi:hypothetical protein
MANIKHVGRLAGNRRKVVVAYRVLPNDPEHCLVVQTEHLDADMHDSLIRLVESSAGQEAYEFAEAMARTRLPDGRIMLAAFHSTGKLSKVNSKDIDMTPNTNSSINLAELNKVIAEQKGVTVNDLAIKGPNGETVPVKDSGEPTDATALYTEPTVDPVATYTQEAPAQDGVLTDEALAAQYRSQADALFKEAKALREQAEALAPTKKKTVKKKESA